MNIECSSYIFHYTNWKLIIYLHLLVGASNDKVLHDNSITQRHPFLTFSYPNDISMTKRTQ